MDASLKASFRWVWGSLKLALIAASILVGLMAVVTFMLWVYVPVVYLMIFLLGLEPDFAIAALALTVGLATVFGMAMAVRGVAVWMRDRGRDIRPLRCAVLAYPLLCAVAFFTPEVLAPWAQPIAYYHGPAALVVALCSAGVLLPREATRQPRPGWHQTTPIDIPRGPV